MEFGPHLMLAMLEGLVQASVLTLTALGLSLVFGVMRVVNVAHPGVSGRPLQQPRQPEVGAALHRRFGFPQRGSRSQRASSSGCCT